MNFGLPFKALDFHGDAFAVTVGCNHSFGSQVYEQILATNHYSVRIVGDAPALSDKDSMDKIVLDVFCWHGGSFRFPGKDTFPSDFVAAARIPDSTPDPNAIKLSCMFLWCLAFC